MQKLTGILPTDVAFIIGDQMMNAVRASQKAKGFGILLAFLVATYGGTNGATSVITALNIAYEEKEKRSLVRFYLLAIAMTLSALRPEWREAATNLGVSNFTYWRRVGLPILFPSLIGAVMLLFANSFGAFATAYALAQGAINLVPILMDYVVNGNVTVDFGLGNALAVGMIVILLVAVSLYTTMLRRVSRWQGR